MAPGMAVQQFGEGFPILFIHGWTLSGLAEASDFEPIFTTLAGYRRFYVDLPGMGQSPADEIRTLDDILEVVSAFIQERILPSKFLLVGSSCGGHLARALAFRYADMVDGLLLRVPLVEPESLNRDLDAFVPAVPDGALMTSLSAKDRDDLGDVAVQTPEHVELIKRKLREVWLPAMAASNATVLDPIRNDPTKYILTTPMHTPDDPFRKPTLIVTGRQDADVGYRDAWTLTPSYPRATFIAIDRADHGLPVDGLGLFEALVKDWLWRAEETQRSYIRSRRPQAP